MVPVLFVYVTVSSGLWAEKEEPKAKENKYRYWDSIIVKTKLLSDGSLLVNEDMTYVFNGSWNGGYREVKLYSSQSVRFLKLKRWDEDSGQWIELKKGNLDHVDHYEIKGGNKILWRNRTVSDPPFNNQKIRYDLEYRVNGKVLIKKKDGYHFSYDFLFPDREGVVLLFRGELSSSDDWLYTPTDASINGLISVSPKNGSLYSLSKKPFIIEAKEVSPKDLRHIDVIFQFTGKGQPLFRTVTTYWEKFSLTIAFFGGLCLLFLGFFYIEYRRGRFKKIPVIESSPDKPYLKEYVLNFLPEEVGAIWDGQIGAPEVSAVLARMILEKKLSSRVISERRFLIFPVKSLQLTLLKPRGQFSGYEKKLINGWFIKGDITDAKTIRRYYRDRQEDFSAVEKIRDPLEKNTKKHSMLKDDEIKTFDWVVPLLLSAVAFIVTVYSYINSHGTTETTLGSLTLCLLAMLSSWFLFLRNLSFIIGTPVSIMLRLFLGVFFPLVVFLFYIESLNSELLPVAAAYLWALAIFSAFIHLSRTRNPPEKLEFRRHVLAIRNYWKKQLKTVHPDLKDEYFPYLMAMKLSSYIDHWNSVYASGSASSNGKSLSGWSGGGGSFGGAGAVGAWSSAGVSFSGISVNSSAGGNGG